MRGRCELHPCPLRLACGLFAACRLRSPRPTRRVPPISRSKRPRPDNSACCGARRSSRACVLPVVLKLPDDVKNLREPNVQELADSFVERRWIDAGPNGLAGKRIEFPGLQLTITDVLVRVEMLDGRKWTTIVHPSQPWVEIAASQTSIGRRGHVHRAGYPAHSFRRRPHAVRAGAAADRERPLDAAEDRDRLHRGAQHHAGDCDPGLCGGAGPSAERRDRVEHSVSRPGDRSLMARRDQLHHSPSLGRGVCVWPAARLWLRQRPDQRRTCRGTSCHWHWSASTLA